MPPIERRGKKSIKKSNTTRKLRNEMSNMRPAREAYQRSPDQSNCYICGVLGHRERFCPYNYIYGQYVDQTCKGECTSGPEQHRITSQDHHKFLLLDK
ncbi:hypothetical protein EJB05_42363, partial [Eragrostis curvula]